MSLDERCQEMANVDLPKELVNILAEIDRNARAYGWEIGRGKELQDHIEISPDNPFKDLSWVTKVIRTVNDAGVDAPPETSSGGPE
jgi:hypothetical protein